MKARKLPWLEKQGKIFFRAAKFQDARFRVQQTRFSSRENFVIAREHRKNNDGNWTFWRTLLRFFVERQKFRLLPENSSCDEQCNSEREPSLRIEENVTWAKIDKRWVQAPLMDVVRKLRASTVIYDTLEHYHRDFRYSGVYWVHESGSDWRKGCVDVLSLPAHSSPRWAATFSKCRFVILWKWHELSAAQLLLPTTFLFIQFSLSSSLLNKPKKFFFRSALRR